ncbi:uncharacterized protein TRAVEDRAFT_109410 [Trametes versicolor FP-101664 SS1]|uniref:uncharacterized protein n=1 Tax=Trametes versicolor (strain FP-101664) TaxID=717944 RepID=UPI0004621956|nr:uncharacterized protein TRAVEDRAFT_109410 [Trametes versicolor FP-101664 SS1]EIW63977.1 hypothetical protein TRAVEDRAFT_109410 [Trametes versicolor FP-101664 SS1]
MGAGGGSECPEGAFRVLRCRSHTFCTHPHAHSLIQIRILLSFSGSLSVTAAPIPSLPVPDIAASSLWLPTLSSATQSLPSLDPLAVFLDTEPTPSSLFTRTKTTCRDHYTAARNRFHIPPPPAASPLEVLLYNEDGDITETSIRNIAFVRRSPPRWVTPSASTGCLPGVMRRWLLEHGRIVEAVEGELKRDGVVEGEYVLTFNGVEGCRIGQIRFNE